MKNQLTTIAALPSGAGHAAHLEPEVGKVRAPVDSYAGYPALDFAVSLCTGEAVDPLTGEKAGRNRKPIEYRKTPVIVMNVVGTLDTKARAQLAADLRKSGVGKWKEHYRSEPVGMPPERKED